jgi:GT2 family glycosyltransferase
MTTSLPKVGIVTVNYNGKGYIVDFVRSVRALHYHNHELFLLDNASTDGSVDELLSVYPDIAIVRMELNVGIVAGNNLGIKYFLEQGETDYILLLNPDTIHKPDFLDELVKFANARTLVAPRSYFYDQQNILNTTVGDFNWWRGVMSAPFYNRPDTQRTCQIQDVELAASYALLVPVRAFIDVGMMDEAYFMYYDDPDFVLRAGKAKYRVVYNPNAIIYHRENRPYMMRKLLGKGWRYWRFILVYFIECSLHYLRFNLMGRKDLVKAMTKGLHDFHDGRMGKAIEKT